MTRKTALGKAYTTMEQWFKDKPKLLSFELGGYEGHYVVNVRSHRTEISTFGKTYTDAIIKMKATYVNMHKADTL